MKNIIQYTLPYEHRVMVGIEAVSSGEAIAKAESLFDQGDIWQDTAEVPLLFDDYEETDDGPLLFTVEQELGAGEPWPEADGSVKALRRRDAAFQAARLLVEAYRHGEESGGSIDWDDLDRAYSAALGAFEANADKGRVESGRPHMRLTAIMEGEVVQAAIADRPDAAPSSHRRRL